MVKFKSVTLRNFLSYGAYSSVFVLDRPGTSLIVGEDLDNTSNGQGANGTGKSSIINALVYGLYDKPVSNISKDNLVNNMNKKNMEVTVEFTRDNKQYRVVRTRKTKVGAAGNNVHLYIDDEDKTLDSAAATNALIESIVGLPYELFVRIVVFSASHVPFLDLPQKSHYAANQTDIIEELFGLTELSKKAVMLKDSIKATESKIETLKTKIKMLEAEHIRHAQQIESAKKRVAVWEQQNASTVVEMKAKLKKIDSVDIEGQRALHQTLQALQKDLSDLLDKKRGHDEEIKRLTKKLTSNESELVHLRDDTCPYCKQTYADAHKKIDECEKKEATLLDDVEVRQTALAELSKAIAETSHNVKETRKLITVDDLEGLIQIKNESAHIKQRVEELQQTENPHEAPLQELLELKLERIEYDDINKAQKLLEHQQLLLKLLTKKDSFVRKALLNKNIPYLNARLQHYLSGMCMPHKVEFTHEMTAAISQFGRSLDFGNLSAGQRARVNLALSFAFRDVLQSLHGKLNVCMLDEAFDIGLDAVGVQAATKLVKRKARDEQVSMYVISHRDEIDRAAFDNTIVIQLDKGFSYIKED